MQITFRPLAEKDLPLLHNWLNRPHMRSHYQRTPISLDDVEKKFHPRLDENYPVKIHIAEADGQPIGQIQCYRVRDYEDFMELTGQEQGVGLDLFIGEETFLGCGVGKAMLGSYVREIVPQIFPDEDFAYISHALSNRSALACSMSVGFQLVSEVIDEGQPSKLLAFRLKMAENAQALK